MTAMNSFEEKTNDVIQKLSCEGCGAPLHFLPGTSSLLCSYCGAKNEIPALAEEEFLHQLVPIDMDRFTRSIEDTTDKRFENRVEVAKCTSCGASTTLDAHVVSTNCPFCASPLIIDHHTESLVRPNAVLPFGIKYNEALKKLKEWGGNLWFAPNDLKHVFDRYSVNGLKGVYIPYWSYNAHAFASYSGQRGEYYYVSRTITDSNGNKRTVQDRRTRWFNCSGEVSGDFTDVLISASSSLAQSHADKIGPWNMKKLVPFDEKYLSGFIAQTYQLDHKYGFQKAKGIMDQAVQSWIRRDIGGDEQVVDRYDLTLDEVTLRYVLLPVYLSSYIYNKKTYTLAINAFTGKVYGQRPYSFWKILFTVIAAILVIAILVLLSGR